MITVKEAAKRLGVSISLVYGWINSGILTHYRLGAPGRRGKITIAEADLDAFLTALRREGRASKPAPPAPKPKPIKLQHLRLKPS